MADDDEHPAKPPARHRTAGPRRRARGVPVGVSRWSPSDRPGGARAVRRAPFGVSGYGSPSLASYTFATASGSPSTSTFAAAWRPNAKRVSSPGSPVTVTTGEPLCATAV